VYRSATGLILNLFLSIILVNVLGSIGAAISTVLIVYLWSTPYNVLFISRILKMNIRNTIPLGILTKVLIVSIGSGVVFLLAPFVRPLGDVLTLAILGLSYTIFILVLFASFRLIQASEVLNFIKSILPSK
jgi:hypothetical protein